MGLRPIQAFEHGTENPIRARHVIDVDESGNPAAGSPYVLVAVHCPREHSELLAAYLIEAGLGPWQRTSKSLGIATKSSEERSERVERFLELLLESSVQWYAAAGWAGYSQHDRAAAVCRIAKATLTGPNKSGVDSCDGNVLVLHDGDLDVYHPNLRPLRIQGASAFNASFEETIAPVYLSAVSKADLTYPEVAAADFIAGYLRHKLRADPAHTIECCPANVVRIDPSNWRGSTDISPKPLSVVRPGTRREQSSIQTRVLAWMDGRQPPDETVGRSTLYERFVRDRITEQSVQTYLRRLC